MILSPTTADRGLGVCGCGQPAVLYGFCRACWSALPVLERSAAIRAAYPAMSVKRRGTRDRRFNGFR